MFALLTPFYTSKALLLLLIKNHTCLHFNEPFSQIALEVLKRISLLFHQAEDSISTTPFLIDRSKISNHQIEAREKVESKQQQLNVLPRVKGIKHESVS